MTQDSEELRVEQVDREAAANMWERHAGKRFEWHREIVCGSHDDHYSVQAFARHRLQSQTVVAGDGEHLRHVIDRDRYAVAIVLNNVKMVMRGYGWLSEEGRGPYAYDDERYQREFGDALEAITAAIAPLSRLASDKTDCTTDPEKVRAAREAGRDRAASFATPPSPHPIARASEDTASAVERAREALERIASCQSHHPNDVVAIARAALSTPPANATQPIEPAISHPVRGGQRLDFGSDPAPELNKTAADPANSTQGLVTAPTANAVERARFLADIGKRKNMPVDSVGELLRLINVGVNITRIAALARAVPDECSCCDIAGENPACTLHGTGTLWAKENPDICQIAEEMAELRAAQPGAVAGDVVTVPRDFVRFLLGVTDWHGTWFGEKKPGQRARFWWRKELSAMLAAASPTGGE